MTGGSTVYSYDTNNNLTSVTRPKDATGDTAGTTTFDYKTTDNGNNGGTFLPSSTATTGSSCSSMTYDAKGNLTDTYAGLAADTNNTCSGATGGKHSHVDYNSGDGTPKDAYGPVAGGLSALTPADETQYFYFTAEPNAGELSKVVKPGGNTTCTTDRTGCTTYLYDSYSRVTSVTDGNNKTTRYSYDANDRITQVLTDGATSCNPSAGTCIQYYFDGEGNLNSRNDRNGKTDFTHDLSNRPATQTQPNGTLLATSYDGAGNLTRYEQTVPGQPKDTVSYTYDAANQLTKVTDTTGTYSYTYNNDGRPTKLTLPTGGVSIAYDYTKDGKVKLIDPSGGTGLPDSYAYDYNDGTNETGKLHKMTTGGVATIYHYDSDDRLKDATPTSGTTYAYTYDADGNLRTAKAGTATTYYGYNENDQLCWSGATDGTAMGQNCPTTPSGDKTYTSDKNGNNQGTSTGPIHYNAQNQVDQISSPSGAGPVNKTYLDQGNNLLITSGNDSLTTGTKLGVTARSNSNGITYYTRDPYGQILNSHGAGGTNYYLLDRQGSTMALIDTTGAKAGSYTYDPYGKTTVTSGTSTTAAQNNPWRYTGGYQDPIDGYYKLGARYYDAAGHFTSADSVAGALTRPEKYNSYTYTAGDPINHTDLAGTSSGDVVNGFVGGVVGFGVLVAVGFTFGLPAGILAGACVGNATAEALSSSATGGSVAGACVNGLGFAALGLAAEYGLGSALGKE